MAGFWNQSQAQIYDQNGRPMVGAKSYFFKGGTTTPITTFAAFALGDVNALPNPVVTDGFGRWPSVFMDEADQFYRVRVTTAGGVIVYDVDGLPIIGMAEGGGGGGDNPVNPTAVASTGDIKARYDTDFLDGWVRCNARTIGSATSGATERANADTQGLFEYLWNKDSNLVVVGGRGATANADWLANKQITLPEGRSRALVGLDGMGNTNSGLIPGAAALGALVGEAAHTLTLNEIPSHVHGVNEVPHFHDTQFYFNPDGAVSFGSGVGSMEPAHGTFPAVTGITIQAAGGGLSHNNVQPSMAVTFYMKL